MENKKDDNLTQKQSSREKSEDPSGRPSLPVMIFTSDPLVQKTTFGLLRFFDSGAYIPLLKSRLLKTFEQINNERRKTANKLIYSPIKAPVLSKSKIRQHLNSNSLMFAHIFACAFLKKDKDQKPIYYIVALESTSKDDSKFGMKKNMELARFQDLIKESIGDS